MYRVLAFWTHELNCSFMGHCPSATAAKSSTAAANTGSVPHRPIARKQDDFVQGGALKEMRRQTSVSPPSKETIVSYAPRALTQHEFNIQHSAPDDAESMRML